MRYLLRLRGWNEAGSPRLAGRARRAVTLLFCLAQSAHDGIANRNRDFDQQRWWIPIYRIVHPAS